MNCIDHISLCLAVVSSDEECLQESGAIKVFETTGILASHVTQTSGQGSTDCPWFIEVEPGQHVNIYLLDFTLSNRYKTESSAWDSEGRSNLAQAEYCHVYAVVKESGPREFTICAGNVRERLVYTSHTHQVEIHIIHQSASDESIAFMLKYEGECLSSLIDFRSNLCSPSSIFSVNDCSRSSAIPFYL